VLIKRECLTKLQINPIIRTRTRHLVTHTPDTWQFIWGRGIRIVHKRITIFAHVELHECAQEDLHFCTWEFNPVQTRIYILAHVELHVFSLVVLHFCTRGFSILHTWFFIFPQMYFHIHGHVDLNSPLV
jgi:hypothetical protein